MGKKLCRYVMLMRRSSNIEGVFVLTDEQFEAVKQMEGYDVYYGEIAGKHSEITCELYVKDIEILSEKENEIAFFERILPEGAGFHYPSYWFDTERAYDEGYQCGKRICYESVEVALEEYNRFDNSVMRPVFVTGFNEGREELNEGKK